MPDESIRDYVLASEQNLRIAATVSDSWLEARAHLVSSFLDRLEKKLSESLTGWEYEQRDRSPFFVNQYSNFAFWKPAWDNQYYIALECFDYGQKMILGVLRDEDNIKKRPFNGELLAAVKTFDISARSKVWWEAQMTMRSPAADWRTPEVLWRMHQDETFLAEVAEQLLAVAKVSEEIIDRMSKAQPTP